MDQNPRPEGEPIPPSGEEKNIVRNLRTLAARFWAALRLIFSKVPKRLPGVLSKWKETAGPLLKKADFLSTAWASKLPAEFRGPLKKYGRWMAAGAGVLLLILTAKSCLHGRRAKPSLAQVVAEKGETADAPVPVKGFKAGRFNFEDSLNQLGTVKGAVEFKLSFEVPGVVSSINYREGERYEEGALLISLRQDDILLRLKRAQAEQNKAETQVKLGEDKVSEHEKLFAMGAIPKTTLDKVKLELDSAKYEAEAARLEVKANEAMLEKSNLYAPSAGMIGSLNVEEGETVTPNTLLGTHIMIEYVNAEFGAVERDYSKLALGQKAKVFIDAYPDKNFEGVVENISPELKGPSRTATVRVRIENPERILLPGMFARVRILLYSKKNTLVVPTDAVQGSEGEQFVYVVKGDEAEKRPITIGYTRPDYSQVDAGISEGEIVALSGLDRLAEAEKGKKKKVRLLETQEAEL